jgi:cytochrome c biogenesis protein CcmG/thiol:disulfide interchange protein DsbE
VRRLVDSICIVLGCALLLTGCHGSRLLRIGSSAPDFSVQDAERTVTLSQLRGQVVVLNFWATWCAPCVEEMPALVEMQRRMKDKGVTVLAVSVDVDDNAYRQFVKKHGVDLLTVRDGGQKANGLYGTFKFPETFVIDRKGIMRRKFIGPIDWNQPAITDFLGKL